MSTIFVALWIAVLQVLLTGKCLGESNYLEGDDIVLTREQEEILAEQYYHDPFAPQHAVVPNIQWLWPNGIIPYVLDRNLNNMARRAIEQAMDEFQRRSCIRFVKRSSQFSYVRFAQLDGCFSYIGRIGGAQVISIGRGCAHKDIVIHEIFHALGRWHEQSRPDRDRFVRIVFNNIQRGFERNFDRKPNSATNGIPYDYFSIMHYSLTAFSKNGLQTIVPLDHTVDQRRIGNAPNFSQKDVQHVNTLYRCPRFSPGRDGTWSTWSSWSSCSRTCNGGTRSRMRRCVGGTRCTGTDIEYEKCNIIVCPSGLPTWTTWGSWSSCSKRCGGGMKNRMRQCSSGDACPGSSVHFARCNMIACNHSTKWSKWSSWTACSKTCEGGGRLRTRSCVKKMKAKPSDCFGEDRMVVSCNNGIPCHKTPPSSGGWSTWSKCSKDCGTGRSVRIRFKETGNRAKGQLLNWRKCNTQPCTPEGNITGLRNIGCFYHMPKYSKLIAIEGIAKGLIGPYKTRHFPITACGRGALQYNYTLFGVVGGICVTGSQQEEDYKIIKPSSTCHDGVGDIRIVVARNGNATNFRYYTSSEYSMDLYQITDPTKFEASVRKAFANKGGSSNSPGKGSSGLQILPLPVMILNVVMLLLALLL